MGDTTCVVYTPGLFHVNAAALHSHSWLSRSACGHSIFVESLMRSFEIGSK